MEQELNWVCPECYAMLAGPWVPQSEALQRLVKHQQSSHHNTSEQSTLRAERPSRSFGNASANSFTHGLDQDSRPHNMSEM
jgi:hypothetical protein